MPRKKRKKKLADASASELEDLRADHRALVARMDKKGLAADNLWRMLADNIGASIDKEFTRREQDNTQKENDYGHHEG
jgi:hypothetical protein